MYSAACGGNFTDASGEIFSPHYPNDYDNNLNCEYTIGKPNQYVSLSFDDNFGIESHNECNFDFITINYSNVSTETQQGPMCGSTPPAERTLLAPVTLRFVTDISYTAHGFKARYEIMNCGATLTESSGVISTPRTPYSFMKEFTRFELELNYMCWQDYVEIRDGLDEGPVIGKICGNRTNVVKSTGNSINQGCGGYINASSGTIQSLDANSDGFYEPNLDCSWYIVSNADGQVLHVIFDNFDVERSPNNTCIYDYVELREGIRPETGVIGRYCGSSIPIGLITSGNTLNVLFHTDDRTNKEGFTLRFQSIASPCGPSALQSRPEAQTLTSINYPNQYPVNIRCSWTISRPDTSDGMRKGSVQLTVNQLDVPCNGDYLEIQKMKVNYHVTRSRYRNRRRYMATPLKLCGSTPVHDIIAPSGLTIFFHSDAINNTARGFSISYKDANCSRVYTAEYGIISNSEYPGRYNAQRNCAITITTTPGKTISAYFSRMEMYSTQSNCLQTRLKVFDGQDNASAVIGSYCGYDVPNPIFSSGNSLYIESTMQHSIGIVLPDIHGNRPR
ncbi:cubilin [Caerostris extrusa]|uniref:Cubilin n=1 Tax=Caerostris extrusa TaxID=172846 RepID=A0AAV4MAA1_CAEEX|nr:cubilin [Caerostris extrusa]